MDMIDAQGGTFERFAQTWTSAESPVRMAMGVTIRYGKAATDSPSSRQVSLSVSECLRFRMCALCARAAWGREGRQQRNKHHLKTD